MKRAPSQLLTLSLLLLMLAACGSPSPENSAQTEPTDAIAAESSAGTAAESVVPDKTGQLVELGQTVGRCAEPAAGQQLWLDETNGYCVVVPADYVGGAATSDQVSLVKGDIMNHIDPRVQITVEEAAGRTLEAVADQMATDYVIPGEMIEQSNILVDGVSAVMLDKLPGQDFNRRVVVLHDGRIYGFFFTPLGEEMEAFYTSVLDSFRFLDDLSAGQDAGSDIVSLVYRGPQEMGSPDERKCAEMKLDASQDVTLFRCDGTSDVQALGKRLALDWADIQTSFGSFTYDTPTETLGLDGAGVRVSEAWQRAIMAWARVAQAELASGRASATGRTALSWFFAPLPEQPDVCTHLSVLNYGYAYAETVECEGGQIIEAKGDWLTDAEIDQFDAWLYGFAPLYLDQNYLDGQGTPEMDATESAAVAQWATELHMRLWPLP